MLKGGFMLSKSSPDSIIVLPKGGADSTVAVIPGAFAEVKFNAHDSTFLMVYSACENPSCSCTDVVVTIMEKVAPDQRRPRRTEFGVKLNVSNWQVVKTYGAGPVANPLIDEFVAGLNADLKNDILAKYRSFRQAVENAARFVVPADKVRRGHMAAAEEVFGLSKAANSCGLMRPLLEERQGIVYRLLDYYCMNPSCKCGETYLSVIRADNKAGDSNKPWITLRFHFEGKMTLAGVAGSLASKEAAQLMAEWIQKDPALLGDIEERYRRIKDVGRRILGRKVKK
jgi:hypothetical protein